MMRLEAGPGNCGYFVWHAAFCTPVLHVVWVDDELNQWCQYVYPYRIEHGELIFVVHQARRIDIFPGRRLVIIDPVEDADEDAAPLQLEQVVNG